MTDLPTSLARIEALWVRSGVPVPQHFGVGLDRATVVAQLSEAGLPDSEEVVEWFSWHNGDGPVRRAGSPLGPSGWSALSLREALAERVDRLDGAIYAAEDMGGGTPAAHWWDPSWLPLADNGGGGVLAAELVDGHAGLAIRNVEWDDPEGFRTIQAPSLREVVEIWADVIGGGGWTWAAGLCHWQGDFASLPSDPRIRSLM
jgi:cell wall assembly regulator SMI1